MKESSFEKEPIKEYTEKIEDGVWKPSIFESHEEHLSFGASTKKLKELIRRPEGKIRITGDPKRFDKEFSELSEKEKTKKLEAARILASLLRKVAPEADSHDIEKSGLEHESDILVLNEDYLKLDKKQRARRQADGIITNLKKKPLMVTGADCAPVGIYDPEKQAIGVFHSGWRGTLAQISPKGIEKMTQEYDSKPENLLVVIGPYADGERFEVGQEVYDKFSRVENKKGETIYSVEEMGKIFKENPENPGHYFLDSGEAIYLSLIKNGVLKENIQVSQYSTMSPEGNSLFSSERIEGSKERDAFAFLMALK